MSAAAYAPCELRPDPFTILLGSGRGRGALAAPYPFIVTDDGIELELITAVIHGSPFTYPATIFYRDYELLYNEEARGYKWTISGYAHGTHGDISNHDAEERISNDASRRGLPCQPDSESGKLFINAPTCAVGRALIDITHELGLAFRPSSAPR